MVVARLFFLYKNLFILLINLKVAIWNNLSLLALSIYHKFIAWTLLRYDILTDLIRHAPTFLSLSCQNLNLEICTSFFMDNIWNYRLVDGLLTEILFCFFSSIIRTLIEKYTDCLLFHYNICYKRTQRLLIFLDYLLKWLKLLFIDVYFVSFQQSELWSVLIIRTSLNANTE